MYGLGAMIDYKTNWLPIDLWSFFLLFDFLAYFMIKIPNFLYFFYFEVNSYSASIIWFTNFFKHVYIFLRVILICENLSLTMKYTHLPRPTLSYLLVNNKLNNTLVTNGLNKACAILDFSQRDEFEGCRKCYIRMTVL